ncbi:MAG: transglutaminase family protein [Pirellulales bacterium]|nr:transglutaminase family protein [Pirellulales bacterium]
MDAAEPAYCRASAYRAFAAELPRIESPDGLFRAAWAISLHELPEADPQFGDKVIGNVVRAVHGRLRCRSQEALLAHLHDVLFDVLEFKGDAEDYYNPLNSYLPAVLQRRRGLPISLTLVYCRVAAGLGLRVHGINAPGHFLAEVELTDGHTGQSMYVDPFFGGGLLSTNEVFERIGQATGRSLEPQREMLTRATPRQWLLRMLHNLQAVFAATGRERDVYAMQELEGLL